MTDIRPQTKRARLLKLVKRKSGASIELIQLKLEWQPHTNRAEISRLRKQGQVVTCASSPKLGGHPAAIRRQLRAGIKSAPAPAQTLAPGAQLVREWNGWVYRVEVAAEGFEMDGGNPPIFNGVQP